MSKNVLITGGSGMVGRHLSKRLMGSGISVSWLGRSGNAPEGITGYKWDIDSNYIDKGALANADYVVHLAGEGIADKRWTSQQRQKIIDSRVKSAALLKKGIENSTAHIKAFISASGAGYYGYDTGITPLTEEAPAGNDFVAEVVKKWEKAADSFGDLGLRVVKLRIGIVLSSKGGALGKITTPIKWGVGSPLGSGKQAVSWIHIDDLCGVIEHAITNDVMDGVYNTASPQCINNHKLTKTIAKVIHRPLLLPNVPSIALKMIFGELANLILGGQNLATEKLQDTGYQFEYDAIESALSHLLKTK